MKVSTNPAIKLFGSTAILFVLAISPFALAEDTQASDEERIAARQARNEAQHQRTAEVRAERRQQFENDPEFREQVMQQRTDRAENNGANPRRRAYNASQQANPAQARRRNNAANPPTQQRQQRVQRQRRTATRG